MLQPLINGDRTADMTDIITNVIGGIIGYVIYLIFRPLLIKILKYIKKTENDMIFHYHFLSFQGYLFKNISYYQNMHSTFYF